MYEKSIVLGCHTDRCSELKHNIQGHTEQQTTDMNDWLIGWLNGRNSIDNGQQSEGLILIQSNELIMVCRLIVKGN